MIDGSSSQPDAGFSLMEMVMVLAIITLLSAGIFTITASTFQLSSELRDHQNRNEVRNRLLEIIETNLLALPAQTKFSLETTQGGTSYTSMLRLAGAPRAFQRSNENQTVTQDVVIKSGKGRGGFIRVTIHYLDRDQAKRYEQRDRSVLESAPLIVLSDRLGQFEWRLYDSQAQEWVNDWEFSNNRRPTLAELTLAHEGDKKGKKVVFWIPPRT